MTVRIVLALTLAVFAPMAAAAPAVKRKPDKFNAAAAEAYDRAAAAQQKGDLSAALAAYEEAFQLSPHPDTVFNEAVIDVQLGSDHEALLMYQMYLDLRPGATDRPQVEAAMTDLLTRPRPTVIEVDNVQMAEAYVLVDGDIVGRPGDAKDKHHLTVALPIGRDHTIAVVTPLSYGVEHTERLMPTTTSGPEQIGKKVRVSVALRTDGNVAVTAPYPFELTVAGKRLLSGDKAQVAAGPQVVQLHEEHVECPAFTITAATDGSVSYAHIQPTEPEHTARGARCQAYTLKQQRLVFPAR